MSDLVPACIYVVVAVVSSQILLGPIFCITLYYLVLPALLSSNVCNAREHDGTKYRIHTCKQNSCSIELSNYALESIPHEIQMSNYRSNYCT